MRRDYNGPLPLVPAHDVVTSTPTCLAIAAALLMAPAAGRAQSIPAGPLRAFDGRLVVSADVTATAGAADDIAFFNYTDYEHNALRTFRFGVAGLWQPAGWLSLVGEVRVENLEYVSAQAAYIRVRPWRGRAFDIQAGRIPPVFGAYGRRTYAGDNALIGYPLGYQYLTSLRADAVAAAADDLLLMRGRGWLASYPVGSPTDDAGLPLVSAFRWDTGVQAHWVAGPLDMAGAITNGTLSNPRMVDDNGRKQFSGRVAVLPAPGLVLGASGARGGWVAREIPGWSRATQTARGIDAEYSRGHWLVRGEAVWSRWSQPLTAPRTAVPSVAARAAWVEGRYRFTPRIVGAVRADALSFSNISGTLFGGRPTPWDAPVQRIEATAGYYLQRNLVARLGVQRNWRDGGRVLRRTYVSAQLSYWF